MATTVSELVSSKPVCSIISFYVADVPIKTATVSFVFDRYTYHVSLQLYDGLWSMGDESEAYLYAQEQDQRLLKAVMDKLHLTHIEDAFQAIADYLVEVDANGLCNNAIKKIKRSL
jgi:hypothetical protein